MVICKNVCKVDFLSILQYKIVKLLHLILNFPHEL